MRRVLARIGEDVAHEVVVNVFAALALGALAFVLLGGRVEDLYLRLRQGAATSGQVAVVTIDEEALYLWDPADPAPDVTPRAMLAEIVTFLRAAGAKVVALDILTDVPAPGDDALLAAVAAHGRVVVAERFAPGPPGDARPFAPGSVLGGAAASGYANLGLEERTFFSDEMIVRDARLVQHVDRARLVAPFPQGLVGASQQDAAPMPALALAAAWLAVHEGPPAELAAALATHCPLPACTTGADALGLPATPVALDAALPINFRGPDGRDGLPTVPAARILRLAGVTALAKTMGADLPLDVPADLRDALAGRVVVVGRVDEAAGDRFVTPFDFPTMVHADMTGPRVQAQLVDVLLTGRHLRRVEGGLGWAFAAAVGFAALRTRARAWHLTEGLAASALLLALGVALFHFTDGLAFDVAPALATLLVALVAVHLYARKEQDG